MAAEAAESKMAKTTLWAKAPPDRWNASFFLIRKRVGQKREEAGYRQTRECYKTVTLDLFAPIRAILAPTNLINTESTPCKQASHTNKTHNE
jgi:hypothetical protein